MAAAALHTGERLQPVSSRFMQATDYQMNSSKSHNMQTGGFAVRAISSHLQHADSVASSTVARQLPVALITTSGCQFCNQVSFWLPFTG